MACDCDKDIERDFLEITRIIGFMDADRRKLEVEARDPRLPHYHPPRRFVVDLTRIERWGGVGGFLRLRMLRGDTVHYLLSNPMFDGKSAA